MSSVDDRIVSMKFDNKNFEENVKTTLSTLDKLKDALNFGNVSEKFGGSISNAADNVNLEGLKGKLDECGKKFSALETIAVGALLKIGSTITDSVISKIKEMTNQLTEGWSKYEEKTQAVQMMVMQGYAIEEVERQMEKLNWFTDETSYNFLDMANNIGKFTAQGVDLELATTAMEGISTWAATSGAGIQGASRAMYNLSQSLGTGAVKLQDWMSIENANMATMEFKQTVLDTAVELGKAEKALNDAGEEVYKFKDGTEVTATDFRENLKKGWFDVELLTATLDKYGKASDKLNKLYDETGITATQALRYIDKYKAGAMSLEDIANATGTSVSALKPYIEELSGAEYELGLKAFKAAQEATTFKQAIDATKDAVSTSWMTTFETIFGNYEKSKILWTDLANSFYDLFATNGEMRNMILDKAFNSGWDKLAKELSGAGIAADVFQEQLTKTAKKNGVNVDKMIQEYGSFYDSLQAGWATSDLVIETLDEIIKKFDEASDAELKAAGYTREDIDAMKELRKSMTDNNSEMSEWISNLDKRSARDNLADSIINITTSIRELMDIFDEAFNEIFFPGLDSTEERASVIANIVSNFAKKIKEFTDSLRLFTEDGELTERGEKIKSVFKGFASVLDLVKTIFSTIASVVKQHLTKNLSLAGGSVLDLAASFGEWVTRVTQAIKESPKFIRVLETIGKAIGFVIDVAGYLITAIKAVFTSDVVETDNPLVNTFVRIATVAKDAWSKVKEHLQLIFDFVYKVYSKIRESIIDPLVAKIKGVSDATGDVVDTVENKVGKSKVLIFFGKVFDVLAKIGKLIATTVLKAIGKLGDFLRNLDFRQLLGMVEVGTAGGFAILLKKIIDFLKGLKSGETLLGVLNNIKESITGFLDSLKGAIDTWKQGKQAEILRNIAISILVLAAAMLILSTLNWDEVLRASVGLTVIIGELVGALKVLDTIPSLKKMSGTIIALSAGVLLLAVALKIIASISTENYLLAIVSFTIIISELVMAVHLLNGITISKTVKKTLTSLAEAMVLLAVAFKIIASVPVDAVAYALPSLVVIMGLLAACTKLMSGVYVPKETSKALMRFSEAVVILVAALKIIATIPFETMLYALPSLVIILGALVGAAAILGLITVPKQTSKALMAFSESILILVGCLKIIETIPFENLLIAGPALIILMGSLVGAAALLGLIHVDGATTASLIVFAASMAIIAGIAKTLSQMDWGQLAKAGVGLVGLVTVLVASAAILSTMASKSKDILVASAAILAMSAALYILAPVLIALGAVPFSVLIKGLLAIAAAFTILGVAAAVLGPMAGTMVALAGAFALLGAGTVLLGAGLSAIAVGLTALTASLAASVANILVAITEIIVGIIGLIPTVVLAIAAGITTILAAIAGIIIEILKMLKDLVKPLFELIKEIALALIKLLKELIPPFIDLLKTFFKSVMEMVIELLPTIGKLIKELAKTILDILIELVPKVGKLIKELGSTILDVLKDLAPKAGETFLVFAKTILNVATELIPDLGKLIQTLIDTVLDIINKSVPQLIETGANILLSLLHGIADHMDEIVTTVTDIIVNFLDSLSKNIPRVIDAGYNLLVSLIDGMANGLEKNGPRIRKALKNLLMVALKELLGLAKDFIDVGKNVIKGIVNGLNSLKNKIKEALLKIIGVGIDAIKKFLKIKSPSRVFYEIGDYMGLGLIGGIDDMSGDVSKSTQNLGKSALDGMKTAMQGLNDALDSDLNTNPTITPVLDLSDVEKNSRKMEDMFNASSIKAGIEGSYDSASKAMNSENNETQKKPTEYNFIQNNYSPKALSEIEIYRRTHNQLRFHSSMLNMAGT